MNKLAPFLALLFLCTPAWAQTRRIERDLQLAQPVVDPDAKGRIELEVEPSNSSSSSSEEQKFDVRIDRIDTGSQTYTLWLESPPQSGTLVDVGAFEPESNRSSRANYERRTNRGPSLPLGATDLSELANLALEVRDGAGRAILVGTVPDIANGSSGNSGSNRRSKGRSSLTRPPGQPLRDATGYVEAEIQGSQSELEVETEHFDVVSSTYGVWIENAQGAMQNEGSLAPDRGRSDHGKIEWREPGGGLPFGAASITELAGRRVEVRDPNGTTVLEGQVPVLGSSNANERSNQSLPPTGAGEGLGAKGKAKTSWKISQGRFRTDVQARARTNASTAELWMENPSTGSLELVATQSWEGGRNRKARFRWDTRNSQTLPFGTIDPASLLGMAIELRLGDGTVILSGSL